MNEKNYAPDPTFESLPDKKKRTPKNADSITKGALNLHLAERVQLRNKLDESIHMEVEQLQIQAEQAAKIANGNK